MTSRLSSLLVRDGVVGVKRMEKAFQRQVLFGGGLDTILLEMTELNEQRLLQYLSLASGLPPATARELEALDPRAAERCPRALAERFHVVPLSFEGDALRILTHDPVDLAALEDLASELGAPVQPFVSPEFRFELAFDRVFGRSSEERFTKLAAASRLSAIPPMGRVRSVVVDAAGSVQAQATPAPAEVESRPAATEPAATEPAATEPSATQPAATEPSATQPAATEAAATEPAAAEPAVTEPAAAEPAATEPAAAEPAATEPAATEPAATEPAATEPAATQPAAPEPAATQPAAPEPAATQPAAPEPAAAAGTAPSGEEREFVAVEAAPETLVPPDLEQPLPTLDQPAPIAPEGRRRTVEMTAVAVRVRQEETARQAAEAYRRHSSEDTEPNAARPDLYARGAEPDEAAAAVASEYDIPDSGDADLTPRMLPAAVIAEYDIPDSGNLDLTPRMLPPAVVITEYDIPDSGDADLTPRMAQPAEEARYGVVAGGARDRGQKTAPPFVAGSAASAASGPAEAVAGEESTRTGAPGLRRLAAFDPTPLTVSQARSLLAQAEHRDTVFEILLRAIRARTWYVALLTVQGGSAIGWVAMVGDEADERDITQVIIPLDVPSAFRQAVSTASPYIGPVATGNEGIDRMIRRMGGVIPPSALLLPLVLRNRVVALLVGHRGGDMLRVTEASELLPLAASASDALGRIIRRGKAKGRETPTIPPPASGPTVAAPPSEPRTIEADATREVESLMLLVEGPNEEAAASALQEALGRAADVRPWLRDHFPGRLKVDRFQIGGRHLRAGQHGPLLHLVVRMGEAAADLVVEKLRDSRSEVRYYAALCASEMRLPPMREALVERLFDSDQGTRAVAIEALSGYPAAQLDDALDVARRALRGEDTATVEAAATALCALADVRAIPELIEMQSRGGKAADIAERALISLTKQDFGHSNRKWRHWWDKNRQRNRIEWLLEGLAHRDPEVRRSAAEDLRRATGEYFGYHHDLPRREREQARQRWLEWWNQTGRLRFLPEGDSDHSNRARPH